MPVTAPDQAWFAERLGTALQLSDARLEQPLDLTVVEADPPTTSEAGEDQQLRTWSVLLRGPASPVLEQGMWSLTSGDQPVELFLVPVGPPPGQPEHMRYESSFSQLTPAP